MSDRCFYNILFYGQSPLSLSSLRAQVRSMKDLAEANGVDFSDEPLEIWAKDDQIGLFVGDTSSLAGEGWFRRV